LNFTGNEGGIFNKFDGGAGSITLSADSGTIFNNTGTVWSITIPSDAATIFNQVQEMNSDFKLYPDAACILNRLVGNANVDFMLYGRSSLIGSAVTCNDFSMWDASGSDTSGAVVSNLIVENDLTIGNNTGLLGTAIKVDGEIDVQLTGSFASIGGRFSETPTGDGVMLDMGPTAGAYSPRQGVEAGYTMLWPIEVDGLHIHADSDSTKNAITMYSNLAYAVCGDAYSGNRDFVASANDSAVLEGGYMEGTFIRHRSGSTAWPTDVYHNEIKLWRSSPTVMGIKIFTGSKNRAGMWESAGGRIQISAGLFTLGGGSAPSDMGNNSHILCNSVLYAGDKADTDYLHFGQDAEITGGRKLDLISKYGAGPAEITYSKLVLDALSDKAEVTLKAYTATDETDIFLDGFAGEQHRTATVLIDDNAPTIDHNYT
jgi:hypothetical protein